MRQLLIICIYAFVFWWVDWWGKKPKRLGHKGLDDFSQKKKKKKKGLYNSVSSANMVPPNFRGGIKKESYRVKDEAPLKFTSGAYSTGWWIFITLCCSSLSFTYIFVT